MVPTIVIAAALIGTIAIIPTAMAHHSKNAESQDRCNKWFLKSYKEFKNEEFLPPGIKSLVNDCLAHGYESPWPQPNDELNDVPPPVLSGLKVNFETSDIKIPLSSIIVESKTYPCQTGKIIIDDPDMEMDINAQVSLEIMNDRTTLMVRSFNMDTQAGNLVLITPCLGVMEN
jgi:hypothetical protein